ncbi:MAG: hypothetical protein H7841_10380 [Magnetospirillum sp. WYHS-4]
MADIRPSRSAIGTAAKTPKHAEQILGSAVASDHLVDPGFLGGLHEFDADIGLIRDQYDDSGKSVPARLLHELHAVGRRQEGIADHDVDGNLGKLIEGVGRRTALNDGRHLCRPQEQK